MAAIPISISPAPVAPASVAVATKPGEQYIRSCTLIVSTPTGKTLDLSLLHIKFSVKRSSVNTPNTADIKIYNVAPDTAAKIQQEYTRVTLQAGYQSNIGVIFRGSIKQVIIGRESATDTFVELLASDGDVAYNFALVSTTIGEGASQQDVLDACALAMSPLGVGTGGDSSVSSISNFELPRGKVLYGNAKDFLRSLGKNTGSTISIQDEIITVVPNQGFLPGTIFVINSQTGMVGSPQQTLDGVNVKVLLNPFIRVCTRVQINESLVQRLPINLAAKGAAGLTPPPLPADGVYFVLVNEYSGDTRGLEWYSNLILVLYDPSSPAGNALPVGTGPGL